MSRCSFSDLGVYRLLIPYAGDEWLEDFYKEMVNPIIEHDLTNRTELLDFALTYERYYGNNKEIAPKHAIHENTIRYRLGKLRNIIGFTGNNAAFDQQLLLAMKIHRIKTLEDF